MILDPEFLMEFSKLCLEGVLRDVHLASFVGKKVDLVH